VDREGWWVSGLLLMIVGSCGRVGSEEGSRSTPPTSLSL
jgi:hypothetical protein